MTTTTAQQFEIKKHTGETVFIGDQGKVQQWLKVNGHGLFSPLRHTVTPI